jgi:hypothetical protein
MKRIKPTTKKYGWRTYIETSLERPVKIIAMAQDKDVREILSEFVRNGIAEVKPIEGA